jgi:hypothetical protein
VSSIATTRTSPDSTVDPREPVELCATASRTVKLICSALFALIWNGIISVFVWQAWKGFERGKPEWFLVLFLIPFVAIGLGAIGMLVYCFLGLFTPRTKLTLGRRSVELGEEMDLSWAFVGRSERVRRLVITIEGMERATYRRGTDSSTDVNVFCKLPVFESQDAGEIRSGTARVRIPAGLMHSFKSNNNEIRWEVKVRGEIPRFPDVSDDFEITILPIRARP